MSGMWDTLNPIDFKLEQDGESFWNLIAELHDHVLKHVNITAWLVSSVTFAVYSRDHVHLKNLP